MAALRAKLYEVVGPDELASVARALLDAAKGGDVQAAKLLLAYTVGRPVDYEADPPEQDRVALLSADGALVVDGRTYRAVEDAP